MNKPALSLVPAASPQHKRYSRAVQHTDQVSRLHRLRSQSGDPVFRQEDPPSIERVKRAQTALTVLGIRRPPRIPIDQTRVVAVEGVLGVGPHGPLAPVE